MVIDFEKIAQNIIPNFKGGEKEIALRMSDDGMNRILNGRLAPGASIGMHTHEQDSEILFVVEGCGSIVESDGSHPVKQGMCVYCPKGESHSLVNDSDQDLVFMAVVAKQ